MLNYTKLLEKWYEINCNGLWEHQYKILIDTLDHPGWYAKINLSKKSLETSIYHYKIKEKKWWTEVGIEKKIFCRCENCYNGHIR